MPAKKKATAKKTASAKSKAKPETKTPPAKRINVGGKFEEIIERLEKLETTVDAIRREYKSKGIPMP